MNTVIVYVDDAAHAQETLVPLLADPHRAPTQWVLVACAPRMTHRISKWVSHSTRENWRAKWAEKLFAQLLPGWPCARHPVSTVVANGPLDEFTHQLQAKHGVSGALMDIRKPRTTTPSAAPTPPAATDNPARTQPCPKAPRWPGTLGSLLSSCGVLWMLSAE
jgi:hypothetical protein